MRWPMSDKIGPREKSPHARIWSASGVLTFEILHPICKFS